jgi:hypothetical protein
MFRRGGRPFFSKIPRSRKAVLADGAVDRDVLVGDVVGPHPGGERPAVRFRRGDRGARLGQRPAQIDRGRSGGEQQVVGGCKAGVGGIGLHRQRHAIGGGGADQGRAAHPHGGNRLGGFLHGAQPRHLEDVRQQSLIDDLHRLAVVGGPDGAGGDTVNPHRRSPLRSGGG